MHIPGQVTGYRIEIPEGQFYIAEACAGLRFLIASIAFGVLYAVTMFRSPLRRAIFIVASILVPIVANGFRALGIVVLGHELGSAQAAETDHVLYGWIFFSIVILLLTLAGTPFRQTAEAPPTGTPSKSPVALMRVLATTIAVLLVSASGPVIALLLDSGTGTAPNASRVLLTPSGCSIIAAHDAGPVSDSEFDCGGARIIVRLEIVPAGSKPSRVIDAARDQITGLMQDTETENGEIITFPGKPSRWIARHDRGGHKSAASSVFIDGHAGDGSLADRLVLSRDLLTGRGCASAAVVVAAATRTTDATSTLRDFLAYQGDLEARIGRLARCGTATSIPDSKSSGDRGLW
jgi:exosortase/archaeosortase family protein